MASRTATPEETKEHFGKPTILAARATQAAEMMGVSRSSFYVNVKLGIYPPARYANGTPVWIVKELNAALEAMPTTRPLAPGVAASTSPGYRTRAPRPSLTP